VERRLYSRYASLSQSSLKQLIGLLETLSLHEPQSSLVIRLVAEALGFVKINESEFLAMSIRVIPEILEALKTSPTSSATLGKSLSTYWEGLASEDSGALVTAAGTLHKTFEQLGCLVETVDLVRSFRESLIREMPTTVPGDVQRLRRAILETLVVPPCGTYDLSALFEVARLRFLSEARFDESRYRRACQGLIAA